MKAMRDRRPPQDVTFIVAPHGFQVSPETGDIVGSSGRLIGWLKQAGYPNVKATDGSTHQVHRLIWVAVHGPIADGLEINHLNGRKADNRIVNLELVTASENVRHAYRTGLASNRSERGPRHILTSRQVTEIRTRHVGGRGGNTQSLALEFGVSRRCIADIVAGHTWRTALFAEVYSGSWAVR